MDVSQVRWNPIGSGPRRVFGSSDRGTTDLIADEEADGVLGTLAPDLLRVDTQILDRFRNQ